MWLSNSETNRLSDTTEKRAVKINVKKKKIPLKKSSYLAAINYLAVFFKKIINMFACLRRACMPQ